MSGIYIHIPFCRQACHYCNFHFSTSLRYKNELITSLLKETDLQFENFQDETIGTIYLGGGTPSLCSAEEISRILDKLRSRFLITADAEITLEANPDDIHQQKLEGWREAGINRLSIGIQS
ncbi:MAG TPA: radical SAM protein, partial [Chitinophagaceae bacterium]|nr:radical SAM protein [Chitinophagaceae bacterium]